jgi:hypothetical protein
MDTLNGISLNLSEAETRRMVLTGLAWVDVLRGGFRNYFRQGK